MIVTVEVSARLPPVTVAMTRKLPVVPPAVYNPPFEMVPPVAVQVTGGGVVLPSLHWPRTVNCWLALVTTEAVDGDTTTPVSTGGAVNVTVLVSARVPPCCVAITRKDAGACCPRCRARPR